MSRSYGPKKKGPSETAPRRAFETTTKEYPSERRLAGLSQAGNTAINRLLSSDAAGRPLDPQIQGEMEAAFETDFRSVRLHEGSSSSAKTLGAEAWTRGEDIFLGPEAPSPQRSEGRELLAHELTHVVQQRRASGSEARGLSREGDRFEQEAETTACAAARGLPAHVAVTGEPPAIQTRKPPQKRVATRAEIEAALRRFLERERAAQKGRIFKLTEETRSAIELLFQDPFQMLEVQSLLRRPDLGQEPAEIARKVAALLPEVVDRKLLERLERRRPPAPPSRIQRVRSVVEETAPAKSPPSPERPLAPGDVLERQKRERESIAEAVGDEAPKERIFSLPLLRVIRIGRRLPSALREEKRPGPPAEVPRFPDVERVVEQIEPDALHPPRAGKELEGSFPDAREVALELARKLDEAHRNGQSKAEIQLGELYNRFPKGDVLRELKRIAQLIRDTLPPRAAGVQSLEVSFGDRISPIILRQETP